MLRRYIIPRPRSYCSGDPHVPDITSHGDDRNYSATCCTNVYSVHPTVEVFVYPSYSHEDTQYPLLLRSIPQYFISGPYSVNIGKVFSITTSPAPCKELPRRLYAIRQEISYRETQRQWGLNNIQAFLLHLEIICWAYRGSQGCARMRITGMQAWCRG